MPVFNLYMKIIRSKIGLICLYTVLFLFFAFFMAANSEKNNSNNFIQTKVSVAVADQDDSTLSNDLINHLSLQHNVHAISNDRESMQNSLYYTDSEYVLMIPQGFQESYLGNIASPLSLENVKAPKSPEGFLVDTQLEEYLSNVRSYLLSGLDITAACERTNALLENEIIANFTNPENANGEVATFYYFAQFFPYVFLSLIIMIFGSSFLQIFQVEVRKRNYCSAVSLKSFNFQVGLGSLAVTIVLLLLLTTLGVLVFHDHIDQFNSLYAAVNMISFTIVSMGMGLFCGFVATAPNMVTMLGNIFGLGFSFLSGVFVPQEFLSPSILPFAKLLPSYWYIQNNDLIFYNKSLSSEQLFTLFRNCGLQVAFAFAIFAAALLISKQKSRAQ